MTLCRARHITSVYLCCPAEFSHAPRQFLTSDTHLFICDSKPVDLLPSVCYVRDHQTLAWRGTCNHLLYVPSVYSTVLSLLWNYLVMDTRLQNLLGMSDDGEVFAISKNSHPMMSKDGGSKWMSISQDRYNAVSDTVPAVSLSHPPSPSHYISLSVSLLLSLTLPLTVPHPPSLRPSLTLSTHQYPTLLCLSVVCIPLQISKSRTPVDVPWISIDTATGTSTYSQHSPDSTKRFAGNV